MGAEAAAPLARDGFTVIVNYVRQALAATATHIAYAISFLAGPDGRWVNGQTLFVNGAFILLPHEGISTTL
jgi:NAD(P)-dependent dehydrogenase (short-subunit alcohol dehydrogenase family)